MVPSGVYPQLGHFLGLRVCFTRSINLKFNQKRDIKIQGWTSMRVDCRLWVYRQT